MPALRAISPIDGRYFKATADLSAYFSEEALIRYRIIVEGEYLIALFEEKRIGLRKFTDVEKRLIRNLYNFGTKDAEEVKKNEEITNHDMKAVEYFIKTRLKSTPLKDVLEWVHFALTSEDTNNCAYALMLSESLRDVMVPSLKSVLVSIDQLAVCYKGISMLARTHGQSASPTTLGKEFKVFSSRLNRQIRQLEEYKILVKLNGATGNYNAHAIAYPKINWIKFTEKFVDGLSKRRNVRLEPDLITTQIEPHDTYAELFDIMRRTNTILIDFCQDMWRYVSDHWIIQKPKKGEIGSSTMPHKINPIDFENGEGNLGLANALFNYFSVKLPISRLQRDLSDSTVERNFGVAFAHGLIAYKAILKGLAKMSVNEMKIFEDFEDHQEIIAEGIQTILRREGIPLPYEKLKDLTRGRKVSRKDFEKFIESLSVAEKTKKELRKINPRNYIGLAKKLAE
jgi:adenylosuccinate lyase